MDPRRHKGLPSYLRYPAACVAAFGHPGKSVDMSRRAIAGKPENPPVSVRPSEVAGWKSATFLH